MNYDYQMGVSTTLKYKGVSLSADLDIRQGGVMYSRTKDILQVMLFRQHIMIVIR